MYARNLVLAAAVLALGVLTGARAQADEERDVSFYTSAFEKLATSNAETETADTTHTAATDIERVRTLIGQGQAYVAADKLDEAAPILERAQVIARYARVKVERVAAETRAQAATNDAMAAEKAANDVKSQADQMETRAKDLESKGL
jgi:hypothetical protein